MDERSRAESQAVALRYRSNQDHAPKLVAKGRGPVADRILELARAHGIPVRQDRNLVEILSQLKLDQEIPPSVYRAVAEILAFVYRMANQSRESRPVGSDASSGRRSGL